jgi:hypothetical protein
MPSRRSRLSLCRQLCVITSLALVANSEAAAQRLWQDLEHGMSVAEVQRRLPAARAPQRPQNYAGGLRELLRVESVPLIGRDFSARLLFRREKLEQVVLGANGSFRFADAERMARTAVEELRATVGQPYEPLNVDRSSIGQDAEAAFRRGQTEILVQGGNTMGDDGDARFSVIYRVPVLRLTIERTAQEVYTALRSPTRSDGAAKAADILRAQLIGSNLLRASFDVDASASGVLTTARMQRTRGYGAVLQRVNVVLDAEQEPNVRLLMLQHLDSLNRKLSRKDFDPAASDASQVAFFTRAIAAREDAERRWKRHRELALYLGNGRLAVHDSRDGEYYLLGTEPGSHTGPLVGEEKVRARRMSECMRREANRDVCMPGWRSQP